LAVIPLTVVALMHIRRARRVYDMAANLAEARPMAVAA
jgi:hypothetical protein